jgi:hypothetical protein
LIVLEFVLVIQAEHRAEITYTYPTNKIYNTEAENFATEKKSYEFCALSCNMEFEIMSTKKGNMLSFHHLSLT